MEVKIEINVLGLRGLRPALGWLPVNKAFLRFDLNSLTLPGEGNAGRKVQTQPKEPGTDPNMNTVISFNCHIPINPLYCPALSVT